MAQKRNITREDIFLKARLLSEGVQAEVKKPPENPDLRSIIALDGCGILSILRRNPYSRMKAVIEGDHVTLSDMGEVLGTATFEERPLWFDIPLSNGQPAQTAVAGLITDVMPLIQNYLCYNQASGQGCRYCGAFRPAALTAMPRNLEPDSGDWAGVSYGMLRQRAELTAEAIKIATDHGWRGQIAVSGGVLPPSRRHELTRRIDIVMEPLHKWVDAGILSSMQIAANCYAPDDFSEFYKWRDLGINATSIDLEVMDPDYFAAVCPAKHAAHPLDYWKEAQVAAAEVFGPWRGSGGSVVMGVEPMTSLVEGAEERLSKGILVTPLNFQPTFGSAYGQFRPPTADWIVEATEKMADSVFRHEDKMDGPLLADDRFGYTRTGRSYFIMLLFDEIWRRGQEMGKLPPGLPKQDGIEPASGSQRAGSEEG